MYFICLLPDDIIEIINQNLIEAQNNERRKEKKKKERERSKKLNS